MTSSKLLDPCKIRLDPKSYYLGDIVSKVSDGKIILPELSSEIAWDLSTRVRFIESILLRVPLGLFYFVDSNIYSNNEVTMNVIDGVQRLVAIQDFLSNNFPLVELEYMEQSGKHFQDLSSYLQRRLNETTITGYVHWYLESNEINRNLFSRIRLPEYLSSVEIDKRLAYLGWTV